jgi:hypothetical protein
MLSSTKQPKSESTRLSEQTLHRTCSGVSSGFRDFIGHFGGQIVSPYSSPKVSHQRWFFAPPGGKTGL